MILPKGEEEEEEGRGFKGFLLQNSSKQLCLLDEQGPYRPAGGGGGGGGKRGYSETFCETLPLPLMHDVGGGKF